MLPLAPNWGAESGSLALAVVRTALPPPKADDRCVVAEVAPARTEAILFGHQQEIQLEPRDEPKRQKTT